MSTPTNPFALVEWRRAVAALYAAVRAAPFNEQVRSAYEFRAPRDALFTTHPASPIAPERRRQFIGLEYYPFDPAWRVLGTMKRTVAEETAEVDLLAIAVAAGEKLYATDIRTR